MIALEALKFPVKFIGLAALDLYINCSRPSTREPDAALSGGSLLDVLFLVS